MTHYKSIIISDLHLGMRGTHINELILFLKNNSCENLFIVGDFIDGWELKHNWHWPPEYNILIQKLLRKIRKGTKIIYIIGNHDEFVETFIDHDFSGIHFCMEYSYGNILFIHGHQFDGILCKMKYLQQLGSNMYNIILSINIFINSYRRKFGFKKWSFSKSIKNRVKSAINYINNFELSVCKYAKNKGFDTIITGHIHSPRHKIIDNINYYNCGDFVENSSLIVETMDGNLKLIENISL